MIPIYTRYLTPGDYGLLELLDLTLNVMAMFVGLNMGSAVLRYYLYFDDPKEKLEVFTTSLIFTFILSILALGVLESLSIPISKLVSGDSEYSRYFQITFLCLAIQTIYLIPETYLLACKKSLIYSSLSIGAFVSGLGLNILFLVFMKMGVLGILLSMLITKALNGLVVSAITLRSVRFSFSWGKLRKIISFSLPLVPAAFSMFIIHFSDRFFIQKFCNLNDLGLYSLGYKFGMILSIIVSVPIFRIWDTQRFEAAKSENGNKMISRIFTYFTAVIIFAGLGICMFVDEIIHIMAASEYQGASKVVPLIVLSYVLYGIANFFTLGIMISNKTKYIAYIQLPVAGANILFNILFISHYGVIGAAISTVLSFLLLATFNFIISQKLYEVPIEYRRVPFLFGLAISIFGVSRLIEMPLLISLGIKSLMMVGFPLLLLAGSFFYEEEITKGKDQLRGIASYFRLRKGLAKMGGPTKE